jgi:S-adenosylmethionine:diacylglycerol 3-amino-3-carboxypropyl transferase
MNAIAPLAERPPFRSDLFYSVQNEDYRTELAVLQRIDAAELRVLCVASSGENALSLLTNDRVASVDAVDINPAQLHLCELRRAATGNLTRDEQLALLGADPSAAGQAGAQERLALYDRLRERLPDAARAFWDQRREYEIAFGVQHVGRNDIAMADLRDGLRAAGFDPLRCRPRDDELPAWQAVYTGTMTPTYIHDLFGLPSAALAERIAGISGYLGEQHFHAVRRPHPEHDPFVTTVFAASYALAAGDDGLPLYLQSRGYQALRRPGGMEQLRLHAGNILELMTELASQDGPYHLISISNIADWMTDEQFAATVDRAQACLAPGGAVLARTATERPMIVEVMRRGMRVPPAIEAELAEVERGPWFRVITAGFRA